MSDLIYRQWMEGLCVCCQGELDSWIGKSDSDPDWEVRFEPMRIGDVNFSSSDDTGNEQVKICGRCVAMRHLDPNVVPGIADAIITAIQKKDDSGLHAILGLYEWSDGSLRSWPENFLAELLHSTQPIAIVIPVRSTKGDSDVSQEDSEHEDTPDSGN